MDNKLNIEQIEGYSKQVTEVLLESFFIDKEKISGEEILNLCTIKQVNLFTLKHLFQEWKNESKKLESPYFDYENKEVITAMNTFKNILSRHILVEKSVFQPMLTQAISDTLMLTCSPYHYYLNELERGNQQGIQPIEILNENKKFAKMNLEILEQLMANFEINESTIENLDLSKTLNEIAKTLPPQSDDIETYIVAFSNYVPLDINQIYIKVENDTKQHKEHTHTTSEEISDATHSEIPTLNETLATENKTSLADIHEKIESLSKGISINQRFMFVSALFDDDIAKFNNTVLELDGLTTIDEAEKYLTVHFGHWSNESDEVKEFMNVLGRRFS